MTRILNYMSLADFLIGVALLAIVPFFLAAYGGHVAAAALDNPISRRSAKVKFWSMFTVGVLIAAVYQYRTQRADEEKQTKTEIAQRNALLVQGELEAAEKSNAELIQSLQNRIERVLSYTQSQHQRIALLKLQNELSKELSKKLENQGSPPKQSPANDSVPVSVARPCRGDNLAACGDHELLEWGRSLLTQIEAINDNYMAVVEVLNKSTVDAKWLEKNSQAQEAAVDQFRDCCAADAVKYHKELVSRVGGGMEDASSYEWAQGLLSPVESDESKRARENSAYRIGGIYFNLKILCNHLDLKIRIAADNSLR
jgi:hypothetical protein